MSALGHAQGVLVQVQGLVEDIKQEPILLDEARQLVSMIRQAEGWLQSARVLLDPSEVL